MILVIVAMMEEASSVSSKLKKMSNETFEMYEGNISNKEVKLIISGIGKVNASMALSYALTKFDVDLVINLGIVGGYSVQKNNTYLVSQASYHDFDLTIFNYEMGQVPRFPAKFLTNESILNKFETYEKLALYTGDSFSTKVINNFPYLADMEGAALFQVAHLFKKDVLSIKIVSDLIGANDQLDNYKEVESSLDVELCEEFFKILEAI